MLALTSYIYNIYIYIYCVCYYIANSSEHGDLLPRVKISIMGKLIVLRDIVSLRNPFLWEL